MEYISMCQYLIFTLEIYIDLEASILIDSSDDANCFKIVTRAHQIMESVQIDSSK